MSSWGILNLVCDPSYTSPFHAVFQNEDGLMEYFETLMKTTQREPRKVIGWVTNELLGHLKQRDMSVSQR